ncbi:Phosphoglycerate mutase family protein [Perilla frutescens var. hirtella]|uniref:Phosphoglycerate mutase family protein n=1 Tax=Perilla frutescens var. hirtella TaxID=608512 RepID=A0AAD4IQ31_PERFH|nr:Phosphoglycerate mutase family protein [Perilla frutescens var. hirtella]
MGGKNCAVERWLPKRIVLVRHGESKEEDSGICPGHSSRLSRRGLEQAKRAGTLIRDLLDSSCSSWKMYVYVSPYECTRSTLMEMGRAFPRTRLIGVREECRVREQDFGNFQDAQKMKQLKEIRNKFGRFFYRFPEGESGADVYDRVSSFLESMWRDIDMQRFPHDGDDELNLMIVSHGLAIRIFLMRWFRWTVEQFELLKNPKNCEFRVMQLGEGGEYSLAVHHDEAKLTAWGLSDQMIADQNLRASIRNHHHPTAEDFLTFFGQDDDGAGEDEHVSPATRVNE